MKITKRQLISIIKEEKARLHENRTVTEMQLADEIVDLLIERRAVAFGGKYDAAVYQAALDYVRDSIVPALADWVKEISEFY